MNILTLICPGCKALVLDDLYCPYCMTLLDVLPCGC